MAVFNIINHQELSGSAATVTHSSISGSYDHLYGVASARSDQSGVYYTSGQVNFNNDTGANYSFDYMRAESTTPVSYGAANSNNILYPPVPAGSALSDSFGIWEYWIPNYSNTTGFKSMILRASPNKTTTDTQWDIKIIAGLWQNTAAITEIDFTLYGGHNFKQYSSFTLYGINGAG
jgi:hypothetical protein